MKITKEKVIEVDEITAIQCDKCEIIYDDIFEIQEFLRIDFIGGYGSIFGDDVLVQSDICQHCLRSMIHGSYR